MVKTSGSFYASRFCYLLSAIPVTRFTFHAPVLRGKKIFCAHQGHRFSFLLFPACSLAQNERVVWRRGTNRFFIAALFSWMIAGGSGAASRQPVSIHAGARHAWDQSAHGQPRERWRHPVREAVRPVRESGIRCQSQFLWFSHGVSLLLSRGQTAAEFSSPPTHKQAVVQAQPIETPAHHSGRTNRILFYVTGSVLLLLTVCRVWLLWERARVRKKLARGEKPLRSPP